MIHSPVCSNSGQVFIKMTVLPFKIHVSSPEQALPVPSAVSEAPPLHPLQPVGWTLQCYVHAAWPLQRSQPPNHPLPVLRSQSKQFTWSWIKMEKKGIERALNVKKCFFFYRPCLRFCAVVPFLTMLVCLLMATCINGWTIFWPVTTCG